VRTALEHRRALSRARAGGPDVATATYLTAPLVMPEMIRRWAIVKTISSGRLIRIT